MLHYGIYRGSDNSDLYLGVIRVLVPHCSEDILRNGSHVDCTEMVNGTRPFLALPQCLPRRFVFGRGIYGMSSLIILLDFSVLPLAFSFVLGGFKVETSVQGACATFCFHRQSIS